MADDFGIFFQQMDESGYDRFGHSLYIDAKCQVADADVYHGTGGAVLYQTQETAADLVAGTDRSGRLDGFCMDAGKSLCAGGGRCHAGMGQRWADAESFTGTAGKRSEYLSDVLFHGRALSGSAPLFVGKHFFVCNHSICSQSVLAGETG